MSELFIKVVCPGSESTTKNVSNPFETGKLLGEEIARSMISSAHTTIKAAVTASLIEGFSVGAYDALMKSDPEFAHYVNSAIRAAQQQANIDHIWSRLRGAMVGGKGGAVS